MIDWRNINHDAAGFSLPGPIRGDLSNRLNREPIARSIDLNQLPVLPARVAVNTLGQVRDDMQPRLGGGDDKDGTIGLARATAGGMATKIRMKKKRKAQEVSSSDLNFRV